MNAQVRVRQGAVHAAEWWSSLSGAERQIELAVDCQRAARRPLVFSHATAAALHGIPVIGGWPERAHATVAPGSDQSNPSMIRTERRLDPMDVCVTASGLRATGLARTALDLAATRGALAGIVAYSHLRRHRSLEIEELRTGIRRAGRMAGIRIVRESLGRSTADSDSPLESLVVARCQEYGFVVPEQQRRVVSISGNVYFVDFAWLDGRILGEADGYGKYGDPALLAGREPADVVYREKLREDEIRLATGAFFRASWEDAWHGEPLRRLLVRVGVPRSVGAPASRRSLRVFLSVSG
ncbi:MAG: hypothetical protein J7480_07510 [Microbacteriaceae bacterium]|nr:hypothetical protein [Microbacteriaceae bacterium]